MQARTVLKALSVTCAGALLASCADQPSSPSLEVAHASPPPAAQLAVTDLADPLPAPFSVLAPFDPFVFNQAPDIMLRSHIQTDVVIQRLVTPPSVSMWHTHPGPVFAIVDQGRVMITRFSKKDGCTSTVYGPNEAAGKTYREVEGEVHRATVLGTETAVEYKTRFVVPSGAPLADPAADPGC